MELDVFEEDAGLIGTNVATSARCGQSSAQIWVRYELYAQMLRRRIPTWRIFNCGRYLKINKEQTRALKIFPDAIDGLQCKGVFQRTVESSFLTPIHGVRAEAKRQAVG